MLSDSEQLEAELAAVRADTQAEISHAAQQEAIARRDRMQADTAAEQALQAGEQARAREQAAVEREQAAEARASEAKLRAEQAERQAQDAIAQAEVSAAAQAAAEASATEATTRAEQAQRATADAIQARDLAITRTEQAERDRDQALEQARDAGRLDESSHSASATLAGATLGEISGTGYARLSESEPTPAAGVVSFAAKVWSTGAAADWPASVKSVVLVTGAATTGVAQCLRPENQTQG